MDAKTNRELVVTQAVDKFKENMKWCLIDGAALLDVNELKKSVQEVTEDVFRFLSSAPKPQRISAPEGKKD